MSSQRLSTAVFRQRRAWGKCRMLLRRLLTISVAVAGLGVGCGRRGLPLMSAAGAEVVLDVKVKEVKMPVLSSTMTEGTVSSWHKAVGDKVELGSILLTVESDKAEMDVESFEEGYLERILCPAGESAKVGAVLAIMVDSKEDIAALAGVALDGGAAVPAAPAAPPAVSGPLDAIGAVLPHNNVNIPNHPAGAVESLIQPHSPQYPSFASNGLDQDVRDQIPPGMTPDGLKEFLFSNAEKNPTVDLQLKKLSSTKSGAGFLDRMKMRAAMRAPPANVFSVANGDASLGQQGMMRRDVAAAQKEISAAAAQVLKTLPQWIATPNAVTSTPSARELATSKGVDVQNIRGTGNFGRVLLSDVEAHLGINGGGGRAPLAFTRPVEVMSLTSSSPPDAVKFQAQPQTVISPVAASAPSQASPASAVVRPLSSVQKTIAKNMVESLKIPVFRLSRDIGTDALQAVYSKMKSRGVTWSTLLAKAVGVVLAQPEHSLLNAAYDEGSGAVVHPPHVNIAMAVAAKDGSLLTPVLRDVAHNDIFALSRNWASLVQKAQAKKISPQDCSGGTFFISNLGHFGVQQFDAILPPRGAGAILSVGVARPNVVATRNGDAFIGIRSEMTVTLTCDHRHINGASAARFLQEFTRVVEEETSLLVM